MATAILCHVTSLEEERTILPKKCIGNHEKTTRKKSTDFLTSIGIAIP